MGAGIAVQVQPMRFAEQQAPDHHSEYGRDDQLRKILHRAGAELAAFNTALDGGFEAAEAAMENFAIIEFCQLGKVRPFRHQYTQQPAAPAIARNLAVRGYQEEPEQFFNRTVSTLGHAADLLQHGLDNTAHYCLEEFFLVLEVEIDRTSGKIDPFTD